MENTFNIYLFEVLGILLNGSDRDKTVICTCNKKNVYVKL